MLREWAPLTDLFKHLPIKIKQGLFQKDINLTCIDVLSEYIVLGTNVGCIYLFERKSKNILKFPCEVKLSIQLLFRSVFVLLKFSRKIMLQYLV